MRINSVNICESFKQPFKAVIHCSHHSNNTNKTKYSSFIYTFKEYKSCVS